MNTSNGKSDDIGKSVETEFSKEFVEFMDLFLEDNENYNHGFNDARTAFNEESEEMDHFDVAEYSFTAGFNARDKEVADLREALDWATKYISKNTELHLMFIECDEIRKKFNLDNNDTKDKG